MAQAAVKVVAFIHSYMPDGRLDPFMDGLVTAFLKKGVELHLVRTNDLVLGLSAQNYSKFIQEKRVLDYVRRVDPAFVFSSNRGGICRSIIDQTPCPIISWFVDLIPFLHHGGTSQNLFGAKDFVVTSSSKNVPLVERDYPVLKGRVRYLPFATRIADFSRAVVPQKDIPISFVGTFFYSVPIRNLCLKHTKNPETYEKLIALFKAFQDKFDVDAEETVDRFGLRQVLADSFLSPTDVKAAVTNAVSANARFSVLEAVADLGLHLYGTENWIDAHPASLPLFYCFRPYDAIDTRDKLVSVYERSKISINVSHLQAMGGLPYRIFDIMASSSMLLADEDSRHDLELLFGPDLPMPLFRNAAHARELAQYYLENEAARAEVVRRCNALVAKGFNFEDRIEDLFKMLGQKLPQKNGDSSGRLIVADKALFAQRWALPFEKLLKQLSPRLRAFLIACLLKIFPLSFLRRVRSWLR